MSIPRMLRKEKYQFLSKDLKNKKKSFHLSSEKKNKIGKKVTQFCNMNKEFSRK
jgi:hypothetical protein